MSKYTLSQKQKDAYRAVARALKIEPQIKEKAKVGKSSYSGFEMTVFSFRERYANTTIFDQKGGAWSKKWKRSWNSIPTVSGVRNIAIDEYKAELSPIEKRIAVKQAKIATEKERLNDVAMKKFFVALAKAKKSSKQTKNVKELLAVESLLIKKAKSFLNEIYAITPNADRAWDNDSVEADIKRITKAFEDEESFVKVRLDDVSCEYLGYRKEILDMRTSIEQEYSSARAFYGYCPDKKKEKEIEELYERAHNDYDSQQMRTSWFKKYDNIQKSVIQSINNTNGFVKQVGSINSYAEGLDTYEPQREDQIHTLYVKRDESGNISLGYHSGFDNWSYIPRGYNLCTEVTVKFMFAYSTLKTKSFITDDRKLKTLEKELLKEVKAAKVIEDKIYAF